MKSIALFNNKGGVSKTTTTFNLGWILAERGHRVIVVDADPQCNLTGMVMGFSGMEALEDFYSRDDSRNIKSALQPVFESRPKELSPVDCVEVAARPGLFLMPGHIQLAEYEVQLGISQELSGSIQALQNIPGSFTHLFRITAQKLNAEYVIVDLSPGLGSINQNLVTTADYLIVPTSPDVFSVMAVESLARVLPRWLRWAQRAAETEMFREADYPFPKPNLKLLGALIQRYNLKARKPTRAFQEYFDELSTVLAHKLKPALATCGMLLPDAKYREADLESDLRLSSISDFNSLIAVSQKQQKPVFSLDHHDVRRGGNLWENTKRSIDSFHETFNEMAHKIEILTA
ncbi:ParA family protein [Amycolatopsis kentuckyensis]|uniref:ParA family protein n=1 Tax=Amycolatopsis kentuckyensis TaxID=218823 RepID=UPI000A3A95C0|nr:AAA family ATPase [Amycolatopsis kentuckyensis]